MLYRSHWCAQVKLYLRMENMCTARPRPDLSLCFDLSHSFTYWGKALRMSAPWYVTLHILCCAFLTLCCPECDKSFTRSDALAKHTRMQHNIVPPAPGRGGNRKRKREEPEPTVFQGPEGYGTFKLEPPDVHGDYDDRISPPLDLYTNGNGSRRSASPDIDIEDSDPDDGIPPYLSALLDPSTGLIMGRPPAMVKYLVMKAKHQYVLEEHASLIEELRAVRFEERRWREAKDAKLDELLRKLFG